MMLHYELSKCLVSPHSSMSPITESLPLSLVYERKNKEGGKTTLWRAETQTYSARDGMS